MKKYFLSLVAMAAMLFATSCQESLVEPQLAGPTTFTVQLPDQMGTKAIGEASSVNKLYVQVYPSDVTKNLVFQTTADVVDGLADVELNLIQDQSYDIIFWAQNGNAYTTADLRSIPMDKKYHNDDEGAAFYAYINDFTPNGVSNQVTLTRPFAQLNLGTTAESLETNAGEVTLSRSYIKVGKVATSFNTVLGQGEGEQTVLFELKAVPTETLTVKVNGVDVSYKYISMDYLAVSSDKKAVVDIEALIETTKGNISHEFTSVPVQKNYRTNIIGNLISSKTDFNIIVNDEWDGENVVNVASDAKAAQAMLDAATDGTTIQLLPGINYGTLYLRPVAGGAQTKVVDWIGNNYRFETYSLFENITIVGAEGATVDAIKIEGGTYYNTEHSQAATYPVMLSLVELKNVVFDGVTFTGKGGYDPQGHGNVINLSGGNIKVDGLTVRNCTLNNPENNARLIYKTESTTHVHEYSYDGVTYTFSPSLKDITITGCTFNGGYMGLELRETNNVTITNNVFNVADRNILLPVNTGCTYSGNITIKENVSNNAHERFVRADGTGDAIVLIKDNIINNYMGADADYIKVTNGNNVTIENNVLGVSTPAQLKEAIIEGGKIELMNDITVDEWIMFSEDYNIGDGTIITIDEINVTIDGKGHTLTVNAIESAGNNDQLFQGASNLNISDLTIKYADGLTTGGLGMVSGVIKNVHFVGGGASASSAAIFPGNGEIKVEGCTFDTNGVAIYFEEERDNLTVTGCTFNQKNNKNVILLYGDVKFTNNTINSGRTVNIVSGSPVVDRNNFNDVRLKVYEAATATVSKNIINTLEFQTTTHNSTFTDNTLSAAAQAALDACN